MHERHMDHRRYRRQDRRHLRPAGRPPRFALIYLHGIGQETLADRPKYTDLFAELGLGCVVPRGGFTWWSDRPLPEYDPSRTGGAVRPQRRGPVHSASAGPCRRGRSACSASAWAGRGPCGSRSSTPTSSRSSPPSRRRSSTTSITARATRSTIMYDSKEQARQDTAILHVHPSRFPAAHLLLLRPGRRLAPRGRPARTKSSRPWASRTSAT